MKKKISLIIFAALFSMNMKAQVKIGDNPTTVNANSLLELESTNKGVVFPRLALTSTTSASPLSAFVVGMTVYNTATAGSGTTAVSPGLYYSDGTKWLAVGAGLAVDQSLGSITVFPFSSVPSTYLVCNGVEVSRTTYASLFAKIGTTYGAGDGSTTFNLPDLRGEFVRGWDDGRGIDPSRTLGSSQTYMVESHNHNSGTFSKLVNSGTNDILVTATQDGRTASERVGGGGFRASTGAIQAYGGTETRPRNIAMVYAIKAIENIISGSESSITYSGSTSVVLNGASFERAALTGDVTAAANSNVTTIANDAVNSAKISDGSVSNTDLATGTGGIYKGSGSLSGVTTVAQGTNTLNFTSTASTGTSHFTVDGSTLNVDAVNNSVGINTATPVVGLDTRGSIHFDNSGTATANQQGGYLTWNRANVGGVGGSDGGNVGFLNHQGIGSGGFVFTTTTDNNTFSEKMRITGTGFVGISTSTPVERLDVRNGGVSINGPLNANKTSSLGLDWDVTNNNARIRSWGPNASTNGGITFWTAVAGGGSVQRVGITGSGLVGIGTATPTNPLQMGSGAFVSAGGVWTNASDARLKSNIINTQYGLAEVMKLRPVEYTMNIDMSQQVGFIAQEVREVVPEVVLGKEGDLSKGETLGVSYGNLVPILTKALQEQQLEIEQLKAAIKALQDKIQH